LFIFFTGIFANFFVIGNIFVEGDAITTLRNALMNTDQLRIGILAFVIMVICDLILTWALFIMFKPANNNLSIFAAMFRMVNVAIFGVALFHLFEVLHVTGNTGTASVEYIQSEIMRAF